MFRLLVSYFRRLFQGKITPVIPITESENSEQPPDRVPPEITRSEREKTTETKKSIEEELARTEFAEMLLAKAREAKPGVIVDFYPNEYSLKVQSPQQQTLFLHNAFHEYRRCNEENRPQVVNKWLRHFLFTKEMPEDFEDVEIDLFPSLRTRCYFEFARLRFQLQNRKMPQFPYQDVAEHFAMTVSYDMYDSIVMISDKYLGEWNLTFYEAMEIAMKNFYERGSSFNCLKVENKVLVYQASVGDGFDGSRLVLSDVIRTLEVYGDTIAQVSNTDSLLITGSDDEVGLRFMLTQAANVYEKPHPMPPILLRLEGDDWVPWLPPESSPMHKSFKRIRDISVASEYHEQQSLLNALYKRDGNNTVIAEYMTMQSEDENEPDWSYTIWQKGKKMLLPKTERIVFMDEETIPTFAVPLDIVCDVVGYIMEPQDIYPQRFLVSEFPTNQEIEEMISLSKKT